MPLLETHFLQSHRELRLAHLALSVMTMGYVWQEGEKHTVQVLPKNLAIPYWEVSQRLGLPPVLTHADGVLANWRKKDPKGSDVNLELLFSLPGGDSVRGFFLVTLMVEKAAVPGLKARGLDWTATGNRGRTFLPLGVVLVQHSVVSVLKFRELHIRESKGEISISQVIPDVIGGIRHGDVAMVTRALNIISQAIGSMKEALQLMHGAFLTRMRDYMPPSHKRFIEDISHGPSLQAFVGARAVQSLTEAYGCCVSRLVDLRSYHISVVSRFVTVPASQARHLRAEARASPENHGALVRAPVALEERGTGGSGIMSFLKAVRDQTKDALITACATERRISTGTQEVTS
ncbi:hypothetical protein P4O66_017444 [Electrophorus voltai]|uniref:Indoleamine 2,3-dioxygenase 2 n=1 Tax=Electrophorus voltai TaxID=2609070 RepID=A0AAD9DNP4_9TELE|nr:hypothetical protein P4O66_017444 [Electrophorus voltai]